MADSLLFDGADDYIDFQLGSIVVTGALTIAIVFKVGADAASAKALLGMPNSSGGLALDDSVPSLGSWNPGSGPDFSTGMTFPAANNWQIIAYSKPDGASVTSRWHRYVYDTDTWTHASSTAPGTEATTPVSIRFGRFDDGGFAFGGNLLIAGWWNSELSDGTIEGLKTGKTAWTSASPAVAWRFDTAGSISSFVGSSTQTDRLGTSVDTGDAPSGWSDSSGTDATVSMTGIEASATGAVVAPPRPRPAHPYSEVNFRM